MSETNSPSRRRLVAGAAEMIRRRGLSATSVRELAKHSGAPLGSTYHYFPGGKEQLAVEAVQWAGLAVSRLLEQKLAAGPVEGLRAFLSLWREVIVSNDFRAGCTVLAVAVEEPVEEATAPLEAAAAVFAQWESLLADALMRHGAEPGRAAHLATLLIAAVEGTVALCRAKRSVDPLDEVAPQLEALVAAALPA